MKTTLSKYAVLTALGALTWSLLAPVHAQTTCVPVPSGTVAWWRAEGNTLDSVGTHHGAVNGTTFSAGEVGQVFVFDGISAFVQVPPSDDFNPIGPFSVEAWINGPAAQPSPDGHSAIVEKSHGFVDSTGWAMQGHAGGIVGFAFGRGGAGSTDFYEAYTKGPALDGQWHHIVGTYSGSALAIYVDGVLQDSQATVNPPV